jgi:hypothetical protein
VLLETLPLAASRPLKPKLKAERTLEAEEVVVDPLAEAIREDTLWLLPTPRRPPNSPSRSEQLQDSHSLPLPPPTRRTSPLPSPPSMFQLLKDQLVEDVEDMAAARVWLSMAGEAVVVA